jgi:hypothetical protein
VDKENLTALLEQYHGAGIGGVEICPIYGAKGYESRYIDYLSPKWMEMLAATTSEGKRLDLGVDLTTGTGWPFGGPEISPAEASTKVVIRKDAAGKYTAVAQSGIQKVKRAAPGGEGWVVDPFSTRALDVYLAAFDRAFANFSAPFPRAQFHDSFEYYGANWTPDFFEKFRQLRGYDLHEHLAELNGDGDGDAVARVKSDYRETLSDLHLAYITRWSEWAHRHGGVSRNQAHGAPGNLIDLYAAADIPETEIFKDPDVSVLPMLKFSSSAAHVTGKNLASSESFTWLGEHFQTSLADAKPAADLLFLSGVNHIFFHGIPYSPKDVAWPGWLFYAAVNFGPNGGLWHDLPAFTAYLARCQSILQSGKSDNDLLLYFPVYDYYSKPTGLALQFTTPGLWMHGTSFYDTAVHLIDRGYSYDAVSDRILAGATVSHGRVMLGGNAYRAVVVPHCRLMPETTLAKLILLAKDGATIIVKDELPIDVPGLSDLSSRQAKFKNLLTEASGLHVGANPDALLDESRVPRESMVDAGLRFIRRSFDGGNHYFIANHSDHAIDIWATLTVPAASAALLDPRFEDRVGVAALRHDAEGKAQVRLQLAVNESVILRTFADRKVDGAAWRYSQSYGAPIVIGGEWKVHFTQGGPALPGDYTTSSLASWTTRDDAEAKRFAGTAQYAVEFDGPENREGRFRIELGKVCESARVRLNGRDLGTLWAAPFAVDIPAGLLQAHNMLTIEVTNLAANRIADLDRRGVNWKAFHEINFVNRDYKPFDASKWPLRDSGLIGPVQLVPLKDKELP